MQNSKKSKIGIIASILLLICLSATAGQKLTPEIVARCIYWCVENVTIANPAKDDPDYRLQISKEFIEASEYFDVPVLAMVGMGYRESVFKPDEVGPGGELGVMQVGSLGRSYCFEYCGTMETTRQQIFCGGCWFKYGLGRCKGIIEDGFTVYVRGKCKPKQFEDPKERKNARYVTKVRMNLWRIMQNLVATNFEDEETTSN